MSEYKFHVNRQFGTEQFALSVTTNTEGSTALTENEVVDIITSLDKAMYSQLVSVDTRSIQEKEYLASQREKQLESSNRLKEALDKISGTEEPTDTPEEAPTIGDTPEVKQEVPENTEEVVPSPYQEGQ